MMLRNGWVMPVTCSCPCSLSPVVRSVSLANCFSTGPVNARSNVNLQVFASPPSRQRAVSLLKPQGGECRSPLRLPLLRISQRHHKLLPSREGLIPKSHPHLREGSGQQFGP